MCRVHIDIAVPPLANAVYTYESEMRFEESGSMLGMRQVEAASLKDASPVFLNEVILQGTTPYKSAPGLGDTYRSYAWKLMVETEPHRSARWQQAVELIKNYT